MYSKFFISFLLLCVISPNSYSQNEIRQNKESFFFLKDTVIKREISTFNSVKDTLLKKIEDVYLFEVPVYYCSENLLSYNNKSTYIHIYVSAIDKMKDNLVLKKTEGNCRFVKGVDSIPSKKVDYVDIIIHSHYRIKIPDSAFLGIYEPLNANCLKKKREKLFLSNSKVFLSQDRRRIYVYMLNGKGNSKYEVIWIINNGKYYGRIVDFLQKE